MDPKELEKKIEELTRQLEAERAQRSKSLFSLQGIQEWAKKLRKSLEPLPQARRVTEETRSVEKRSVLQESMADNIETYRNKLGKYTVAQLEDIYLHLNREAHPQRFAALVEELRRRPLE